MHSESFGMSVLLTKLRIISLFHKYLLNFTIIQALFVDAENKTVNITDSPKISSLIGLSVGK